MEITLTIPDKLAAEIAENSADIPRLALEALAVEGYRTGRLSAYEVRQLLGHESRWETETFLSAHNAWPGTTVEDIQEDIRTLEHFRAGKP